MFHDKTKRKIILPLSIDICWKRSGQHRRFVAIISLVHYLCGKFPCSNLGVDKKFYLKIKHKSEEFLFRKFTSYLQNMN